MTTVRNRVTQLEAVLTAARQRLTRNESDADDLRRAVSDLTEHVNTRLDSVTADVAVLLATVDPYRDGAEQ